MALGYTSPAVVVGAGINGLGVIRSLGRAGVPVIALDTEADAPGLRSRYARAVLYPRGDGDGLIVALENLARDCGPGAGQPVLLLTTEEAVAVVTRQHERLMHHYKLTLATSPALLKLTHKEGVRAAAEKAGIRIPKTVRIRSAADMDRMQTLQFPVVVKPACRQAAFSDVFDKAYRCEAHVEASDLVLRMLPVMADIIVQEWIEGGDSDLYFCLQYLPADERSPVSFVGRKIRCWPPGVGGTASCVAAPEADGLAATSTAFFRNAGVYGLLNTEFKRDGRSGDYLLIEPTVGRTDFQAEVATLNGVNLPLIAYCDVLGLPWPLTHQAEQHVIWRERMSDSKSQAATLEEHTRWPVGARTVDALWRLADPQPALASLYRRILTRLRKAAIGREAGGE